MWIQPFLLLLAIPVGYLIAWLCKDELKDGRKYFRIVLITAFALAVLSFAVGNYMMVYVFLFIAIVTFISYVKATDKKFIKGKN